MVSRQGSVIDEGKLDQYRELGAFGQPVHASYAQIQAVLKQRLGERGANLFARPQVDRQSKTVRWIAPVPGAARRFEDLSEEEQGRVALVLFTLKEQSAGLLDEVRQIEGASDSQAFASVLSQALVCPSERNVFLVGDQPVLTFWGFEERTGQAFRPLDSIAAPGGTSALAQGQDPAQPTRGAAAWPWWYWALFLLLLLLLVGGLLWWLLSPVKLEGPFTLSKPGIEQVEPPPEEPLEDLPEEEVLPDPLPDQGAIIGPGGIVLRPEALPDGVSVDPEGRLIDPETGEPLPLDPESGLPIDPETGLPLDPMTGEPLDPEAPAPDLPELDPQDPSTPPPEDQGQPPPPPTPEDPAADPGADPLNPDGPDGTPPPDQAGPEDPPAPGESLNIPPPPDPGASPDGAPGGDGSGAGPGGSGDVGFMQGQWSNRSGLVDRQGRPVEQTYEFDDSGQGQSVIRRADGSRCTAPAQARMADGRLVITEGGNLVCPDGEQFQKSETVCERDASGQTQCKGDGYSVRIERATP
ncbi:MAG: hypothetical protein ACPGOY_09005 [Rhodospirillaceae bacterium]